MVVLAWLVVIVGSLAPVMEKAPSSPLVSDAQKLKVVASAVLVSRLTGERAELLLAVAWQETRFRSYREDGTPLRGAAGECGVMQTIPRYTGLPCWALEVVPIGMWAGAKRLAAWRRVGYRRGRRRRLRWLCHYNGGHACEPTAVAYAASVLAIYKEMQGG